MGSAGGNSSRPHTTPDGKLWQSSIIVPSSKYYCVKFTKEILCSKISGGLKPEDGNLVDLWVLTRIDHWDNDNEITLCLTNNSLLFVNFNFINEKYTIRRVSLNLIRSIRIGNLVTPNWSVMQNRDYGVVQLIWGDLTQVKWLDRWNPLSQEIPRIVLHHHPCFYSKEKLPNKDLFDCDLAILAISKTLAELGLEIEYGNIRLNSRLNFLNVVYNQSNLGFCKDRNGVSF